MDYTQFRISRFAHWDLFLHQAQFPYIGRCYAAAIRPDADLVTEMTLDESQELFGMVVPAWHRAVNKLYGPSRPNVAILGNDWNHLHAHLIPRFHGSKTFYGLEFIDPNPAGNYAPYPKRTISSDILLRIRSDIENAL